MLSLPRRATLSQGRYNLQDRVATNVNTQCVDVNTMYQNPININSQFFLSLRRVILFTSCLQIHIAALCGEIRQLNWFAWAWSLHPSDLSSARMPVVLSGCSSAPIDRKVFQNSGSSTAPSSPSWHTKKVQQRHGALGKPILHMRAQKFVYEQSRQFLSFSYFTVGQFKS
jgi:hypothetical protein